MATFNPSLLLSVITGGACVFALLIGLAVACSEPARVNRPRRARRAA